MALPPPWKSVRTITEGGQAWLYEVRRDGDEERYVLKRLKDPDRSGRFEQQVAVTDSLHQEFPWAFPKVEDSGTDGERPYY